MNLSLMSGTTHTPAIHLVTAAIVYLVKNAPTVKKIQSSA